MRRKRWLYLVVIVAVVGGGFWGWRWLHGKNATPSGNTMVASLAEETAVVKRGTLQVTVDGSGNIEPSRSSSLSFSSSGTVAAVLVTTGQRVKAGQSLAKLDTTDLELQLKQAEANLKSAQAQLDDLKASPTRADIAAAEAAYKSALSQYKELLDSPSAAEITVAKVQLEQAKVALAKAQAAYDKVAYRPNIGMLPQSFDLQDATLNYEKALAQYQQATAKPSAEALAAAKSNVEKAKAQLESVKEGPSAAELAAKQAALLQAEVNLTQARRQLQDATLVAPFDGTVVAVDIQPGDKVTANKEVIVLNDLTHLQAQLYLDETDVAQVTPGQEASISVDAFPDTLFEGKVASVGLVPQVQSGVVLYSVTIDLDPTAEPLLPGMTADGEITVTDKQNALVIPLKAVHKFGNRFIVFRKVPAGEMTPPFRSGASSGKAGGTNRPWKGTPRAGRASGSQAAPGVNERTGENSTLFRQLREAGFVPVPVDLGVVTDTQAEILGGLKEGDIVTTASLSTPATGTSTPGNRGGGRGSFRGFGLFGGR